MEQRDDLACFTMLSITQHLMLIDVSLLQVYQFRAIGYMFGDALRKYALWGQ